MNYWTAWTILGFALFFANLRWQKHSQEASKATKGTVGYAVSRAKARKWRLPGFAFWFVVAPSWITITWTLSSEAPVFLLFWVPLMLCACYVIRLEYRTFRQQIKDDKDDWTSGSKRGLKRVARSTVSQHLKPLTHSR